MFEQTQDPQDKAKRIFSRLVEMFEEQGINPSPLNYYVWYKYLKGDLPAFRQEMESILNDPFGYSDRAGRRLYNEYLKEEEESDVKQLDRAFRRLIDVMVRKVNAWSNKLEHHTEELDRCTTELSAPDLDAKKVQDITKSVLNAAHTMKESSLAFQQEMHDSSAEMNELRQQLIEAQAEALQDELTEIGNRKMFNNKIEEMISQFQGKPDQLAVVIADIDHFKKFNDNYGHLIGDSILRYFANIMKKQLEGDEIVCRYGGEEFVILMPNRTLEEAKDKAEKIRITLQETHLKRKDEKKPISTITSSFGVAMFDGHEEAEELVGRADDALYFAKEHGRNQVISEEDLPPKPADQS